MADIIKAQIGLELSRALEKIGADIELKAIIGSYGDTLTDEEVLEALRAYNDTGSMFSNVTHISGRRPKLRIVRSDTDDDQ